LAPVSGPDFPDREHLQHIYQLEGRMFPYGNIFSMATTIYTPEDLGRAVRQARRDRGLTQDDLALASGTGRRFVFDLEHGKRTVRLHSVLAVLAALGLSVELHPATGEGAGPRADA
jgi:HTH-type transcriptional regulator/antitoxin HipB